MRIKVSDGNTTIYIKLYDSKLSASLLKQLPLTLSLTEYSENEKYLIGECENTPSEMEALSGIVTIETTD